MKDENSLLNMFCLIIPVLIYMSGYFVPSPSGRVRKKNNNKVQEYMDLNKNF